MPILLLYFAFALIAYCVNALRLIIQTMLDPNTTATTLLLFNESTHSKTVDFYTFFFVNIVFLN